MDALKTSGQCLCGAVTMIGAGAPRLSVCHCSDCRRWNGGPATCVSFEHGIEAVGLDHVRWFRSSDWAERGSCIACGSALFYRLVATPEALTSGAGSFDLPAGLSFAEQIYIDNKPDWYAFDSDAPCLTEAEVIAQYAPKDET